MKTCTMCHKTKPLNQFTFHPRGKLGRSARCLECRRIEYKNWAKKVKKVGHKLTKPPTERFYSFIDKLDASNGCWEWTGSTTQGRLQYGRFTLNARPIYAHRYSYKIHFGEIPIGMLVLHKCDTPSCVNPAHLFLGTHKDNSLDMVNKNRQARHSKNGRAILSEKDVVNIRKSRPQTTTKELAASFNVSVSTIQQLLSRRTWKHITQ